MLRSLKSIKQQKTRALILLVKMLFIHCAKTNHKYWHNEKIRLEVLKKIQPIPDKSITNQDEKN